MTRTLARRDFLAGTAALAGAAATNAFTCVELAAAAPSLLSISALWARTPS